MNARVYDPDIGRFLSPDPTVPGVHNPQAFNRYAYAFNSPLNLIDPDGFEPRAPDGSFADGGYRGANSGPTNSGGPNAGNQGTPGAGNAVGTNMPQGKQSSGLGLKGSIADMFPDEAPIHQIGKVVAAVAAYIEGKVAGNQTLADIAMQDLQNDKQVNINLLGILLGGRAPGNKGPGLNVSTSKTTAPNPYGKKGGPAHQEMVQIETAAMRARHPDLNVRNELQVKTPNGEKGSRFADVAAVNPKTGGL